MKYHLITYGCQMNTADSTEMAQPLKDRGMIATGDPAQADIILMNTCTVREQAEHRAHSNLGRLREWKEENPQRILIVAGCAATRWGESIKKQYPFIDLVSPATRIEEFPETVAQVLKERWNWTKETLEDFGNTSVSRAASEAIAPSENLFGDDKTAYITIMRGCNYTCSYCIVPQVRGRESYRPLAQILEDVRANVALGFREVMLVGQTVNSYYDRGPEMAVKDFADLLRAVDAVEGLENIRFMSPHPRHMKPRVIQAMADCKKVARHLHLPIQSGSDRMLAAMKRLYTRADYLAIVQQLRSAIPGIMITTDVIVGYPGETDEDFKATLDLMNEIKFDGIFAFKYSPRPGTTAADLPDDVNNPLKEERLQTVLALNRSLQAA